MRNLEISHGMMHIFVSPSAKQGAAPKPGWASFSSPGVQIATTTKKSSGEMAALRAFEAGPADCAGSPERERERLDKPRRQDLVKK